MWQDVLYQLVSSITESHIIKGLENETEYKMVAKLCLQPGQRTKATGECALGGTRCPRKRVDDFFFPTPDKNPLRPPVPRVITNPLSSRTLQSLQKPSLLSLEFKRLERPAGGTVEKPWLE